MKRRSWITWLVTLAAALYLPGMGTSSLWDPWETHYGEVAREMLARDDLHVAVLRQTQRVVDEALAVGDVYFRQRCMRKVHELRSQGITILLVSHATGDVRALGDRAMWLEHGRMMAIGATDLVVSKYLAAMNEKDARYLVHDAQTHPQRTPEEPPELEQHIPNIDYRFGDGRAELVAKETGLTRQTVYRIKDDPGSAEAALAAWGL